MNMKKSLLAAAVTGALAVPTSAMAVEAYGKINLALLSENDDAAVQDASAANEAGELQLVDGASRFGFMGEEDLGNGLTAAYRYEFSVDATQAGIGGNDRLSWVALSGDFGQLKAGRMWVNFYNHVGSTADLGDVYAAAPGYYALPTSVSRESNWVEYNSVGGPFQFSVAANLQPDSGAESDDFDRLSISGSFDAGPVNIGLGNVSTSDSAPGANEPSMTGFAVSGSAGNLGYGGSYVMADLDNASSQEPTAIDVYVSSDFGGGLSGFLGFSQFDNDTTGDVGNFTSIWGHIDRALSSRTRVYGEFQSDSIDGGAPGGADLDPQRFLVGINHAF